jgi:hypothetical protein
VAPLLARAALARARVAAARGDLDDAIRLLEAALDGAEPRPLPWLRASLLVELARLREQAGDATGAALDASTAAGALAELDVVLAPADVELLERLARPRAPAPPARPTATLVPGARWWVASCGGTGVRLQDTKGLRYLAILVEQPDVERHALDLVDRVEGVDPEGRIDRRALGDAGAALDASARESYRRRIEVLRSDAEDALAAGQLEAAEAAQDELDQLVQQLAHAFGVGGRDRRAASAAERARLNVTRALRAAIAKLVEAVPGAGEVLDRRVRTGLYCVFEPTEADEVRWIVQRGLNGPDLS